LITQPRKVNIIFGLLAVVNSSNNRDIAGYCKCITLHDRKSFKAILSLRISNKRIGRKIVLYPRIFLNIYIIINVDRATPPLSLGGGPITHIRFSLVRFNSIAVALARDMAEV
jgi:hypothetical protein